MGRGKSIFGGNAMRNRKDILVGKTKEIAGVATLALLVGGSRARAQAAQSTPVARKAETQMTATQSKFFCNIKALTPEERAHHKQLSEKLMAARKAALETENGYEFQFGPQDVTLAELADWVVAESKCCPFFDFHIDLENEGKLICLRLTGEEGVKQFMRAEFAIR
jgi:hypothetical protein